MTTTGATMTATATLVQIVRQEGQCADCSREVTARLFTVRDAAAGELRDLGRRCAAKATGYAPSAIEREAARVVRMAEVARRRAVLAAAGITGWPLQDGATADYAWTTDAAAVENIRTWR